MEKQLKPHQMWSIIYYAYLFIDLYGIYRYLNCGIKDMDVQV